MKIGVCAGHGNGSNVIPEPWRSQKKQYNYSEGTTMHMLAGEICKAFPQIYNARPETGNPSWYVRSKRLKAAGCKTVMELHTNWSLNSKGQPNRGTFLVITSLCYEDGANQAKRAAEEKAMATKLFKPLADAMGLRFEIRTRKGGGKWDYYSFINECRKRGIPHAFIVEHGYHMDFADDIPGNIKKAVTRYGQIYAMLNPSQPPVPTPTVVEYVFKKGDTLWSIAQKYGLPGTSWVLFKRKDKKPINPLNMHIGDVLLIPVKK